MDGQPDGAMWRLSIAIYIFLCAGFCETLNSGKQVLPEHGMLDQFLKRSYEQCVDNCNKDIKCVWSKYYFRLQLCMIYGTNASNFNTEPGMQMYKKSEQVRESDKEMLLACEANTTTDVDICQVKHCGESDVYPDAEILGNMYGIGAKVRYNCIDGTDFNISTCQPGGQWTTVNLSCNCSSPPDNDHITYTLKSYNKTYVAVHATCDYGYLLVNGSQLLCQISSGQFTDSGQPPNFECVEWIKIYEYKAGSQILILDAWKNSGKHNESYVFRDPLIDTWKSNNIIQVKLEVISNNTVVAFMVFNGTGSSKIDWFSHTKLINTTWSDLNSTTTIDKFNVDGRNGKNRRFFVSKSSSENEICTQDTAWFVVTWSNHYGCIPGMPSEKQTVIMYSNGTEVSHFKDMKLADSFKVSIKTG